ncbi:MAG: hypothetical protein WCF08_06285 [Anaerolineaceae bacterium]
MLSRFKLFGRLLVIGIILITLAGNPEPVSAVSYNFASPTGTPVNACTYTDPCNLQKAVDISSLGGIVFAAAGTYHPYTTPSDQVLLITNSVHIYGGWDGISGPDPVPDPTANISIIDGQNSRQGVTIMLAADEVVTLSGFTIRNGNATGLIAICSASGPAGCGGGIMASGGKTTIEDCIIEDNVASTTTDATYRTGYGGGIYIQNPGNLGVTIQNNIIRYNDASTASCGTLAIAGKGGGIYIEGESASGDITITENEIYRNEAAIGPDCIGRGVGLTVVDGSGVISRNYIHDNNQNHSSSGSGLFSNSSFSDSFELSINENRFINNQGADVVYLQFFNGSLASNTIINPESLYGVSLNSNYSGEMSVLVNNVIAQNTNTNILMNGGATTSVTANLYYNTLDDAPYGISLMSNTYLSLTNSIVSHHSTAGIKKDPGGTNMAVYIADTLFHGNTSDGDWNSNLRPISGDPLYADTLSGDYHIQAISAARDTATNAGYAYDFENDPRPMGSGATPYDVGADEFWWKIMLPMIIKSSGS